DGIVPLGAEDALLSIDTVVGQGAERLPGPKEFGVSATQQKETDRGVCGYIGDDTLDPEVRGVNLPGDCYACCLHQWLGQSFAVEYAHGNRSIRIPHDI